MRAVETLLFVAAAVIGANAMAQNFSNIKLVGHQSLTGEQALLRLGSDRLVCEAQAAQAGQVAARQAESSRRAPTPYDESLGIVGALWEGQRQARSAQNIDNAIATTMLTCMSERGWLFARR